MLFKITISLLTYFVDPDKINDKQTGLGKLSTRVVVMLVMLIMIPSAFQLLSDAQSAFLPTLPRVILGTGLEGDELSNEMEVQGGNIAWSIYSAFVYNNTEECTSEAGTTIYDDDGNKREIENGNDKLNAMFGDINRKCVETGDGDVYQYEYNIIISTLAGGFMCYVLIGMCVTVAIRTFKLMILRMIAPVPVISYIDPKSSKDGAFSNWLKILSTTWLDLFINLGILYIVIYAVNNIILDVVGNFASTLSNYSFIRGSFFTAFMIIGLFAFAKQAPKFITDALGIKSSGNFMKALGSSAAVLGGIGAGRAAFRARQDYNEENGRSSRGRTALNAGRSLFSGLGAAGAATGAVMASDKPGLMTGYDAMTKHNATMLDRIGVGSTAGGRLGSIGQTLLAGQTELDQMENEWKAKEEQLKYAKQKNAERKVIMDRASSKGLESLATSANINVTGTNGRSYSFSANAAKFNSALSAAESQGVKSFTFEGQTIDMEDAKILQHEINDGNIADYAEKALSGAISDSVITGADARYASANDGVGVERTFGGSSGLKANYGTENNRISDEEMAIANEKNSIETKRAQVNRRNTNH